MKRMKFDIPDAQDASSPGSRLRFGVQADLHALADTVLGIRALRALDSSAARFPLHRRLRLAVRRPLEELFDDLALKSGLGAQRLDTASLLLEGPGVFVNARGRRKPGYSSGRVDIWAESRERLDDVRARLHDIAGEQRVREEIFTIDWRFHSPRFGLESVEFDELADPDLIDEAYPTLAQPVATFIERYLNAPETVLILQGPPGTGKTRLVRGILAALTRRKGDSARVLYTADRRTLETDEIFVEFITGSHEAFVIEDADHLLSARVDGNLDMHRFLAVADGVVRALGRKIIFTTNLPNVGDIDDALVRPGRCFGIVRTRRLESPEAERLLEKVTGGDRSRTEISMSVLQKQGDTASLAEVFRAVGGEEA
jgi:SpoVK/Ycf46/Vps4 family AAA+-type ATPase